jgi:hypothetical protein
LIIRNINELHKLYLIDYNKELYNYRSEKIKEAIDYRCRNLSENQRKMINSIAEREIKTVVLDRVLIKKDDQENLITDEEKIKEVVNDHFQNIAGSINKEKLIPSNWIHRYSPIDIIDDNIYKNLMAPPTEEEWEECIKNLPNDKAARPSTITYEMIKKSSKEYKEIIRSLVSSIFYHQKIPEDLLGWLNLLLKYPFIIL